MSTRALTLWSITSILVVLGACEQMKLPTGHGDHPSGDGPMTTPTTAVVATATPTPTPGDISVQFSRPVSKQEGLAVIKAHEQARTNRPAPTPTRTPYPIIRSGDVVVSEKLGLMWTADIAGGFSQADAVAWCEGLTTAGCHDWRLPAIADLKSLLNSDFLPNAQSRAQRLWSASPHPARGFLGVDLATGDTIQLPTGLAHAVCIRAAD